jgi:hypothetical protein
MWKIRSNRQEFIKKAINVHRDKYDYSMVEYTFSSSLVNIVCPLHGVFKQRPNAHLRGQGCPICGRIRTNLKTCLGQDKFINESLVSHGDKYDYSLVKYRTGGELIKIVCPKHGLFEQKPGKHMRGQGCPKCARELKRYNELSTKEFLEKAEKIHGNRYDYSLVNYNKSYKKIKIICSEHGLFEQTPNNHLMGMKCGKCALQDNADKRRLTTEEFVKKARRGIHKDRYGYLEVNYKGCDIKVKIKCPVHGIFLQTPAAHIAGKGCPLCLESQGEIKIVNFLVSLGIAYKRQKTFKKCKNVRMLPYDFFIPSLNICIEYDGRQHFEPIDYYGGVEAFERLKKNDAIKNKYCNDNDIRLVRISYKMKNKIEGMLATELDGIFLEKEKK